MDISPAVFQRFDYVTYVEYLLIAGALMMGGLGLWSLHEEVKGLIRITVVLVSIYLVYLLEQAGIIRVDLPQFLNW